MSAGSGRSAAQRSEGKPIRNMPTEKWNKNWFNIPAFPSQRVPVWRFLSVQKNKMRYQNFWKFCGNPVRILRDIWPLCETKGSVCEIILMIWGFGENIIVQEFFFYFKNIFLKIFVSRKYDRRRWLRENETSSKSTKIIEISHFRENSKGHFRFNLRSDWRRVSG